MHSEVEHMMCFVLWMWYTSAPRVDCRKGLKLLFSARTRKVAARSCALFQICEPDTRQGKETMDRSALLNNAGAQQLQASNYVAALELFRTALEAKLHRERNEDDQLHFERCVTPEMDFCHPSDPTKWDILPTRRSTDVDLIPQDADVLADSIATIDTIEQQFQVDVIDHSEAYYLFTKPFELSPLSDPLSRGSIACVVFNIAVLHHLQSRQSPKAAAFYDLAASLLSQDVSSPYCTMLRIAILNNFFVWTYANSSERSSQICMYHLSVTFGECCTVLPEDVRLGVRSNLLLFSR
jgi:hypothetical protein